MAAGLGSRMRSRRIKVLHPLAGRMVIDYPIRTALAIGADPVVVVVGHQRELVGEHLRAAFPDAPLRTVVQEEQLGTGHAVACAAGALRDFVGDVYILSGDVPLLPPEALTLLDEAAGSAPVAVVGMHLDEPARYGRLLRDGGTLSEIVEAADCTPAQLETREVNAGIYRVDAGFLFETLGGLGNDNAQGEHYLTDLVAAAREAGLEVRDLVLRGDRASWAAGINDRRDLAYCEAQMQARLRARLMDAGVTMVDPGSVFVHDTVEIGPDTVLEPGVMLLGSTRVGSNCVVERGVRLTDTQVGDGVHLRTYTVAEGALIEAQCIVGPFARLREGSVLRERVKVGNFVETKKTELGVGAKASHLTYLGDASVGPGSNIGAGTITCNYDGKHKHRTEIGAGAFIGSDTQLVAPVRVGDGAYVGAGTTVTQTVPPGALALSRSRQKNIPDWVERRVQGPRPRSEKED